MKLLKCKHCGLVLELIYNHQDPCLERFEEIYPNSTSASTEKHEPVAHVDQGILKVRVASVPNPMEDEHCITSIFVVYDQYVLRKNLTSNDIPEATFYIGNYHGKVSIYEYCNLHGLWKTELDI